MDAIYFAYGFAIEDFLILNIISNKSHIAFLRQS